MNYSVFRYKNKKNKQKMYRIFFFFLIWTENEDIYKFAKESGKNWMLCIMESVHQFYFSNRWLLQLILQNNKISYAETRI